MNESFSLGNDLNPGLWRTEMRQSFRAEAFQSIPYDFSFDAILMKCEFQEVLRHENKFIYYKFLNSKTIVKP